MIISFNDKNRSVELFAMEKQQAVIKLEVLNRTGVVLFEKQLLVMAGFQCVEIPRQVPMNCGTYFCRISDHAMNQYIINLLISE